MPRPNVTTFTYLTAIPRFHPAHPLGGADLPPDGSPGNYQIDAVLGIPGESRSAFTAVDWEQIAARGDSLLEVPGAATGMTQPWLRGGPDGEHVISIDFNVNADRRLATATTQLAASGFSDALVSRGVSFLTV